MIKDGYNGFIVPKRDPEAIAEKLILLLERDEMHQLMGEHGQKLIAKRYTRAHFINGLVQVFNETLDFAK